MEHISFKVTFRQIPEIIFIAALYYFTAKLGQTLAIPPGNITPIWIPSGLMLAAVLMRGYYIWPGIFLGAFVGNVWAYIDINSLSGIFKCLFTGSANGIGDVLSAVGAAYLLKQTINIKELFNKSDNLAKFILFGVVAGPAVSAIFGVTPLCIAGYIPWSKYVYTLTTWWTGDGVGALLITPVLLVCATSWKKDIQGIRVLELVTFATILLAVTIYCLSLSNSTNYFNLRLYTVVPILMWSAFRFGQSVTFFSILFISTLAIILTTSGYGPFSGKDLNQSLTELQLFLAVISITIYMVSAVIKERSRSEQLLKESLDLLEERVKERTAKLNQEIKDRKQTEAELHHSELKSRAIIEASLIPLALNDEQQNITFLNQAFIDTFGYTLKDIPTLADWWPQAYPDLAYQEWVLKSWQSELDRAKQTKTKFSPLQLNVRCKDGRNTTILASAAPLSDEFKGEHLVMLYDITESRKAAKENEDLITRLKQAQKMEAIGTLAGGIAHDFNNLLSVILGYTELAKEDAPPEVKYQKDLESVLIAGNRAKDLVKQILTFSRQSATERIPLNIQVIIKEGLKMLRSSIPTTISIIEDIDPQSGVLMVDPTQIHQILINLCTNAYHAMGDAGGTLSVTLKQTVVTSDDKKMLLHVTPGEYVELVVSDTGMGIGPDVIEKIFDPYFTTKEINKGTGMGLAIIHGIIKDYSGAITVESLLGQGSTFHVYFPVIEKDTVPVIKEPEDIFHGKERILFIDDEELLVEMGQSMLERLGYHVTTRRSSLEALSTFQQAPDDFDLVITDQTMPNMTGSDLARRMMQIRPDIPIILCTGFSNLIDEDSAKGLGIKEFALKPLTGDVMSKLIRKALDD